jgi:hypothetical protein
MVEDLFELNKVVNQDIVEIIDKYQLNTKSRKREHTYMRYYLYDVLKKRRYLTHVMIGMFFNRNHSSVTLGLKEHKHWWKSKDIDYLKAIQPIVDIIDMRKTNFGLFNIKTNYIDVEESQIVITGNFNLNLLDKLPEKMTKEELINVFKIMK